jgi:hypothetical protein
MHPIDIKIRDNLTSPAWEDIADLVAKRAIEVTRANQDATEQFLENISESRKQDYTAGASLASPTVDMQWPWRTGRPPPYLELSFHLFCLFPLFLFFSFLMPFF